MILYKNKFYNDIDELVEELNPLDDSISDLQYEDFNFLSKWKTLDYDVISAKISDEYSVKGNLDLWNGCPQLSVYIKSESEFSSIQLNPSETIELTGLLADIKYINESLRGEY